MKTEKEECKIIPFKTKEQKMAEIRFRHLADHLYANPCFDCKDIDTPFCLKECKSGNVR
jgi:hypothetical protein